MKRLNNLFRYTHILFNFKVSKPLRVKFLFSVVRTVCLYNPQTRFISQSITLGLTLNPLQRC